MTELLKTSSVFDYIPGRHHKTFKNIKPNIIDRIDKKAFLEGLQVKKAELSRDQTLLKFYRHKV